jgi:hypothetical protein
MEVGIYMPYIVTGDPSSWKTPLNSYREDLRYKYPEGLNLRPDSDFHIKLRSRIWERAQAARNEISKRFPYWNEIDRTLTAYIPLKDEEEVIKNKDDSKPVSIVFPYSYSTLEALMTYMTMAFFQDPMFQYDGVDDSDTLGAMLMELLIKVHCSKNKVPLNVHTVLRDSFAYGIGAAIPEWTRRWGKKPVIHQSITESVLGQQNNRSISMDKALLFEGNALSNIDPYMLLIDPSVSSADIQKGEFVGWVDRTNYMSLLAKESEEDSGYFNVKYLKDRKDRRSTLALDESLRQERHGGSNDLLRSGNLTNPVDTIKMYITLIPKDWELSSYEYPEKWYFELASDDVIITCHQADHNHGMYPIGVASPEFDGYSVTPIGRMEILYGLQHILDFLFNSHVTNVRKALNDMFVVDPYLINIEDLKDPKPGKLVRTRRPAWGHGVKDAIEQLQVNDVTRANIGDASFIINFMDRISGADQAAAGALRQGGPERLTGTEFQGTRNSQMGRMQRIAQIVGLQFFQDIGTMFAVHTQQYMQEDTFVKIAGRYRDQLTSIFGSKKNAPVTPFDLAINYDLLMRDGSIPGGNFSQSWLEMFKTIGTTPELMKQFDVTRIFMYIAKELGAKNVEDFRRNTDRIQPTSMPDEEVAKQVQAGNMIPAMSAGVR